MKKTIILWLTVAFCASAAMAQSKDTPAQGNNENYIFTTVETAPEYPGGTEALYQFLAANFKHPGHQDTECSGKVYVTFVVEKDGSVSNAKVLREDCKGYGEEALRVVKLMPKWKPGRSQGKPVRVQYNLPINFKNN